jgi:predicted enzyme related to lactoylglutathione lyase
VTHPFNTFCFAELQTPDVERSAAFYGDVFGWDAAPAADDFKLFRLGGNDIIGLRRATVHRLIGHVKVDSVDRVIARAIELGASLDSPAVETPRVARTAVVADPDGATFGVWESRGHDGAHVQDQVGSMWWMELLARDIVDARHFYTRLFGWDFSETPKYEISERPYTVFKAGNAGVGGALQYHPDWGVRQRWSVFFSVADWSDTIARVKAAGGELGFWRDVPHTGRCGFVEDPGGAHFVVMRTLELQTQGGP